MLDEILPFRIARTLDSIPYNSLCELRLRTDDNIIVNINGENFYLLEKGFDKDCRNALSVGQGVIQSIIQKLSKNSLYSINDQLIEGFITYDGGIRVGICGDVVSVDGKIKTIKNISSINFRFPHFVKNCSLCIYPYIVQNGEIKSTLIISPPGAGKTTFLRDIIYQISRKENLVNILVVDERQELSGVFDGKAISRLSGVDVYSNSSKKFAFNNGIRSMKPDVIVTDEINIEKDIGDIENALTSGVKVFASIHADNINDLKNKSCFKELLSKSLFDRFVVLSKDGGIGVVSGVYNSNLKFLGV